MAALNKIAANSPSRQNPSELETQLANALYDLENNTQDLKASLRPLQFVSAREVSFAVFSFRLIENYVFSRGFERNGNRLKESSVGQYKSVICAKKEILLVLDDLEKYLFIL